MEVARIFDLEAGFQDVEGDFARLRGDRRRRLAGEVEMIAIADPSLGDPPAADPKTVGGPSREGLQELRQPRQIAGGRREGEGPPNALRGRGM
jgi:hypothetical protein